jgi:uncharacterized protein YceH (UPF0502 family)
MSPDSSAVESPSTAAETPPDRPALSPTERRILGVLVEKQKTSKTADAYPLTLNALITGCTQKSNREPVTDLDEVEVEEGLTALQQKGLVERLTGGRAERFKHKLYEAWTQNGPELAVLAELLLRGAQTKGELRGRAGRMDTIGTLDELDAILHSLAARHLVRFLGDPARRGSMVTHGFNTAEELAAGGAVHHAAAERAAAPAARSSSAEEIEGIKTRLTALEATVAGIMEQLKLAAQTEPPA